MLKRMSRTSSGSDSSDDPRMEARARITPTTPCIRRPTSGQDTRGDDAAARDGGVEIMRPWQKKGVHNGDSAIWLTSRKIASGIPVVPPNTEPRPGEMAPLERVEIEISSRVEISPPRKPHLPSERNTPSSSGNNSMRELSAGDVSLTERTPSRNSRPASGFGFLGQLLEGTPFRKGEEALYAASEDLDTPSSRGDAASPRSPAHRSPPPLPMAAESPPSNERDKENTWRDVADEKV